MKSKSFIPLFITAFLFVFVFLVQRADCSALIDRVVATVNDDIITWSELRRAITSDAKVYLQNLSEEEKKVRIGELERPMLENLIVLRLQLQEAMKFGMNVSDDDIKSAVNEIKNKYGLDDAGLARSLEAEGLTIGSYKKRLSEQIILQRIVNFAVKSKLAVTDDEIKEYYEKNREKYNEKEKVRIRHIFFSMPADESRKAELMEMASEITDKIKAGESFSEMALRFSEGPNKESGGDLGYISKGSALKEIEDISSGMKVGEVSKPFWSPAGLHIIKVEERTGGAGLENAKDRIKDILLKEAFKSKYNDWITDLREKAHIEIKL